MRLMMRIMLRGTGTGLFSAGVSSAANFTGMDLMENISQKESGVRWKEDNFFGELQQKLSQNFLFFFGRFFILLK